MKFFINYFFYFSFYNNHTWKLLGNIGKLSSRIMVEPKKKKGTYRKIDSLFLTEVVSYFLVRLP